VGWRGGKWPAAASRAYPRRLHPLSPLGFTALRLSGRRARGGWLTGDMGSRPERIWRRAVNAARARVVGALGGAGPARVVVVLSAVGGLASADVATVGASASQLRESLGIGNADVGLLVAVSSLVGAAASVPFGMLADRARRTTVLSVSIALWGVAMFWGATVTSFGTLLLSRLALGVVTGSAGPVVASLVGDFFPGGDRGRTYSFIGLGELIGAGVGFAVTGDIAVLSWRAAFASLAVPAFALVWFVARLPEPVRGETFFRVAGSSHDKAREGLGGRAGPSGPLPTDAQRLAIEQGIRPHPDLLVADPARMGIVEATRYILRVKTNIFLIVSGACGYYFFAGVETFGVEFVKEHYHIDQALANLLMIVIGGGAVAGVAIGGPLGDHLLRRGKLHGRVLVAAVAAAATPVLFVPVLATRSILAALPYIVVAALARSAQNPPIDAARLDVMPAQLWGRAEGVRTLVRAGAQAVAPLLFGAVADLLGGGHSGLLWTFAIMLVPLGASAYFLFRAVRTVAADVATAAALAGHSALGRAQAA
jgi:MFS family permease